MVQGTLAAAGPSPVAKAVAVQSASLETPPVASPAPSVAESLPAKPAASPLASPDATLAVAVESAEMRWASLVAVITTSPARRSTAAAAEKPAATLANLSVEKSVAAPAASTSAVASPAAPAVLPTAQPLSSPTETPAALEADAKPAESKVAAPTALAPGFRFHPTDEELVSYYLKRKVISKPARYNAIGEIDLYKYDPWELEEFSRLKTRDQDWFFFGVLDKKYGNGARLNRSTKTGYWKATGKDREVRRDSKLLGMKKTLVFHTGRAPDGMRTNWVMHQYRLADSEFDNCKSLKQYYVLCRVFHKSSIGPPNNSRYAPFVEEEWEDTVGGLIPTDDSTKEAEQETQPVTKELIDINELPQEAQPDNDFLGESENVSRGRKRDRNYYGYSTVYVLKPEVPLPSFIKKKRYHDDSGSSTGTDEAGEVAIPLPPDGVKLFQDMQRQIHQLSCQIKTLRLDKIASESLITILQTRIDTARKENEELKKSFGGAVNNKE